MNSFECEALKRGYKTVAGSDEAGRGPLAGPVVAAVVAYVPELMGLGIDDSKKLSPKRREELAPIIRKVSPAVAFAIASPEEIDRLNIHNATLMAMKRAVSAICAAADTLAPDFIFIDGRFIIPGLDIEQEALIKGDSRSICIAAASIIAKTERDKLMNELHLKYPVYNFVKNKGYPTKEHFAAIMDHGITPVHRMSYAGIGAGGKGV